MTINTHTTKVVHSIFNDPIYQPYFIGYQDMIKRIKTTTEQFNQQSYPPFNVKKIGYNKFVIEIAVAGFDKADIDIEHKDSTLTIKSDVKTKEEPSGEEWIHRGIGLRKFTRQFTLADTVEVTSAEMVNGMLKVWLEDIVPDEQKPRKVNIV
jgi:molecular chaperone IbpA